MAVEIWEWEQLGRTEEFGEAAIALLEADGWRILRQRAFAGAGILLIATRPELDRDVRADGRDLPGAALALLDAIAALASAPTEVGAPDPGAKKARGAPASSYEQLELLGELDDGLTWDQWFRSLPRRPA